MLVLGTQLPSAIFFTSPRPKSKGTQCGMAFYVLSNLSTGTCSLNEPFMLDFVVLDRSAPQNMSVGTYKNQGRDTLIWIEKMCMCVDKNPAAGRRPGQESRSPTDKSPLRNFMFGSVCSRQKSCKSQQLMIIRRAISIGRKRSRMQRRPHT
jgi:hypothetical protein